MLNVKAIICYDGSSYYGFQSQKNGNTIQNQLQNVLFKLYKTEIKIIASGRTDSKVHALGQVINFKLKNNNIELEKLKKALNSLLKDDIKVLKLEYVDLDFHSRFSAKSRIYKYFLKEDEPNPFEYKYCYNVSYKLDLIKLNKLADYFIGTKDFKKFSKIKENINTVKTIYKCYFYKKECYTIFLIEADGFLWSMVRMILSCILECYTKNKEIKNNSMKNKMPSCGLYLYKVIY